MLVSDRCLRVVAAAVFHLSLAAIASAQSDVDLAELILMRDSYRQAGQLESAQTTAMEVVRRLEARYGESAIELSEPLLELARIHRGLSNQREAEAIYLRVLAIIQSEGKGGPDLITPYRELARSFIEEQRYGEALTTLEEARNLSRRNFGLFNMGQVQLFDDLTDAYLGLDETRKAQQMQEEKVELAIRNLDATDPLLASYREQLADYYSRSRLKVAARQEYREALLIYGNQEPPDDSGQLRALSNIMRLNFVLLGDEDEHLRIGQILAVGDITIAERATTLALLGDFYFVRVDDPNQAERYWSEAYRLLQMIPAEDAAGPGFEKPLMLDFVAPLNQVDQRTSRRKRVAWGELVATFSVDAAGRAADVQIQMSEPDKRLEQRYVERIEATHFRPTLHDSVPVATPHVRLTHAYRFFVD